MISAENVLRQIATPGIAVIVPNYNDARYLPRCIRSVLDQEAPPDEMIIVDDKSTDNSLSLIRSMIAGQPRARLIENPTNLGVYGALDRGLDASHSDYVLFLSANDSVMPGIFAHARSCLARHPGVGLWSAMGWLIDENDHPIRLHASPVVSLRDAYVSPGACVKMAYRLGNWSVGSTLIYHRATLESVGRFDAAYMGLADLVSTLMVASRQGATYSPIPFGASRIHSGSYLSRTLSRENLEAILTRLRESGPRLAPELFTPRFLERMTLRLRFAAARSGKANLALTAASYPGLRGGVLDAIGRLPQSLRRTRVALAFLAMCPFDVVPAMWNRLLGSVAVLALLRFRRSGRRAAPLQ